MKECENCTEWLYFEPYGYRCFYMMSPLNAEDCEFYCDKNKWNKPESESLLDKLRRLKMNESDTKYNELETKHNPCDYCLEIECENNGIVCPFYREVGESITEKQN